MRTAYIHSDVDTLERIQILDDLRAGIYDVLIGVNLLREGLDLPEVSLVAILDADKEGFLRSHRSLTQTVGRAARNLNGTVIMYADKITESMRLTIDETNRRRSIQLAYNESHGITPQAIIKAKNQNISSQYNKVELTPKPYETESRFDSVADPVISYMNKDELIRTIENLRINMVDAAKNMEFIEAARIRDEILNLENLLKDKDE